MTNVIYTEIQSIILNHIIQHYDGNSTYAGQILTALKVLLNDTFSNYDFPSSLKTVETKTVVNQDLQIRLSKINEKESRRKKDGVFYTDNDVTDFMVLNSLSHYINPSICSVSDIATTKKTLNELDNVAIEKLLKATVFDPTCGAGAFLISALSQKIELYKSVNCRDFSLSDLVGTIKGNDIESVSTDITKIRLFFLTIDSFEETLDVVAIAKKISKSFFNYDLIDYNGFTFGKFNIIVGNPPYIEYGKYNGTLSNSYGNVYADVMRNVVTMLSSNGVLAFVVPLSYISTLRMAPIRDYIQQKTGKQILLNFADRPDCLFDGVHQKLTIVFAQNTKAVEGIFTSKYHHWYQTERGKLFDNLSLSRIEPDEKGYWPKIGDAIALSIYKKIKSYNGDNILAIDNAKTKGSFFLNLRACFWMKVFSHDMHSNSYKKYAIDKSKLPFVLCLLNSSLFFLMWTIISDGWHITNKELSFIKIPNNILKKKRWVELVNKLEEKLENTKEYVGTKQVEYEYKHKFCKDIIDEIDEEMKSIYGFTEKEVEYIKSFNEKYRVSDGA